MLRNYGFSSLIKMTLENLKKRYEYILKNNPDSPEVQFLEERIKQRVKKYIELGRIVEEPKEEPKEEEPKEEKETKSKGKK